MQEEYVRRLVSPDEVEEILGNPRLIEAARTKMEEDLSSGKLDLRKPTRRVGGTVAEWYAKTSLTVVQRAQAPCKTTVEKPRRSYRGFSLSRVFSLSIELYKWAAQDSNLEPRD